ncbi:acyl-CoA N-acyltransferase [Delitschia confertaspora ATCC 74209]|uniref:Acyl-CoA N-acyltransferase n=1 Tax=Delitschia confertaspora ATCC 74209 TaxID=1513339 RepID=A0A9P4JRU7_9PLEO|nr:acyl-CoA N-acyltransferase [Delitschia confertaspora ATCC 74209]
MLQSSITAWLKKPTAVLKPKQDTRKEYTSASSESQSITTIPATQLSLQPSTTSIDTASAPTPDPAPSSSSIFKQPTLPPLPPNVEFVPLTDDLISAWKRLNAVSFPISYPQQFYDETMEDPVIYTLTIMALWNPTPPQARDAASPSHPMQAETETEKPPLKGAISAFSSPTTGAEVEKPILIGAIRCRRLEDEYSNPVLYLSTISVLSPYRHYGIATHLLQQVTSKAMRRYGVRSVTAHVWEKNEEGLEWYAKRGFEVIGKEEWYYRKLRPGGAMLVRRLVGVRDMLEEDSAGN